MSNKIYIYASDEISEKSIAERQEEVLTEKYGEEFVFIVCEDNSFISNDEETAVLIQEYFE